jgi:hypothetical protein
MYLGHKQSVWIDIDKGDVAKIKKILDRETDGEFLFGQLRIEIVGMEDEQPTVTYKIHVYGEDAEGKNVNKDFVLTD